MHQSNCANGGPAAESALTFERFHRATAGPLAPERSELFDCLPADAQKECWADLAERCQRHHELLRTLDPALDTSSRAFVADPGREPDLWPKPERPRTPLRALPTPSDRDVLLEVEPVAYVEALTGVEVPRSGVIRCPLPDHEDRTPSFHVYGAERGFYCFGCHRGGTVYDFAAALWDLPTRGSGFVELRRRVAEALLGREAA